MIENRYKPPTIGFPKKGAGTVPLAYKNNKLCFIFGREKYQPRKGLFGPPVGAKEVFDQNSSFTAFRETCEETDDTICPFSIKNRPHNFVVRSFPHESKFWILELGK